MLMSQILKNTDCEAKILFDTEIQHVTSKVDSIKEKTLFFLFKAFDFDTKKIIKDVILKNPTFIITDLEIAEALDIPIIKTPHARRIYSYAAYNFAKINSEKLKFYAVTGTNGKTTTATMIYNIFRSAKIKCGFIGTGRILIDEELISDKYYSMTTPDPDVLYPIIKRMENEGCEKIVMEVSSHALSLQKVAPIKFDCSIFTNLSAEHLDFHKTILDYYNAKLTLFKNSLRAIFNLDDYYAKLAFLEISKNTESYTVSINDSADASAKDITHEGLFACSYIYREANRIFKIKLNYGADYNIANSLLAIKCALLSEIDEKTIQTSLAKQGAVEGRFEKVASAPTVIIDYAHTHEALRSILNFVKDYKCENQRIITLFGCGGQRDRGKRPKMAEISESYSDLTIVTSDNSRKESTASIILEITGGFKNKESYKVIENRKEAIIYSIEYANENDIILLIGKGHERYNIDACGYHSFDERNIIKKAIEEKNKSKNENQTFS